MPVTSKFWLVLIAAGAMVVAQGCDYKPRNQGRVLYNSHCQSCHMEAGQGLGSLFPPVAQSDYVKEHAADLACLIRHGISGDLEVNGAHFSGEMAGFSQLSEVEINNLVHYILVEMNGMEMPFSAAEVRSQLDACSGSE